MIRTATITDAARLAELSGQLGYPVPAEVMTERLARLLPRDTDFVLVFIRSQRVAGWAHAVDEELLETGRRCQIQALVVDAAERQAGVGRELVIAIEQWAGSRGITSVVVRSNVVRAESHPFYERLGYQRTKSQHVYAKGLPA